MHATAPSKCLARQRHGMGAMFEEVAFKYPKRLALLSHRGILSYTNLNERANRLARHLTFLGIGSQCVVAVALERGIEYVVAMLASWKIGAAYLPLDQSLPAKRMHYMMSDSGTSCLITTREILEKKSLNVKTETILCLDDERLIGRLKVYPSTNVLSIIPPEATAYIIYTSGTTGDPKGVAIAHENIFNLVDDIHLSHEIAPFDRVLLFSPFCFDASIRDITGVLTVGASLYVPKEEEILPGNLMKTIAQHGITNSVITPSALRTCNWEHLPGLKTIVVAGEAAHETLIRTWGAGRRLINAYGPTEATVCCTKQVYVDGQIPPSHSASVIGKPILNTNISILDSNKVPIEDGEIGEICVTGPGVSHHGYLNLPKLNTERFGGTSLSRYRSYITGDLGRILPGGQIECLGRKNCTRQIKLNGQRIELQEIENVLRSSSNVLDAVIVLRGEASCQSLCAYMVPTCGTLTMSTNALTAQLMGLLTEHLPAYSVPSIIEVIDVIPLTANKKLDINTLSHPTFNQHRTSVSVRKPVLTPLESKVAVALLEGLDLPTKQLVWPTTTYGELGGSSLQASLVLRHLNHRLGCNIQLGQFYRRNISVRDVASLLLGKQKQSANPSSDGLLKRTILPHDVAYNLHLNKSRRPKRVLLTGSTGFLGSHLLAELLSTGSSQISCVVRARNKDMAFIRVKTALQTWGLWEDSFVSHLDVYCGDVCKPFLGMSTDEYLHLAKRVDTVYHSAATVNFIAPFSELEDANVTGTVEVLRFASALTQKRLTYISTLSVFFGAENELRSGREISVRDLHTGVVTGYAQSKWVSEQLVLNFARMGGHALIVRPGRLLGNIANYRCPQDDFTIRLIASMLESGVAPNLDDIGAKDWQIDLTPVDYCAKKVHQASLRRETGIRNVINQETISFETIVNSLGGNIRRLPYQDWLHLITKSTHRAPLSPLFHEPLPDRDEKSTFEALLHMRIFRCSSYEATISKDDIYQLPSSGHLLLKYLELNPDIFSCRK